MPHARSTSHLTPVAYRISLYDTRRKDYVWSIKQ